MSKSPVEIVKRESLIFVIGNSYNMVYLSNTDYNVTVGKYYYVRVHLALWLTR